MVIQCGECGKKGTLDEQSYLGKRVRLRCPYCSREFFYTVAENGNSFVPTGIGASRSDVDVLLYELLPSPRFEEALAIPQDSREGAVFEAKRIARLIITEIKLYNQDKIERVQSKKEVIDMLKHDLIKGKQHYNTRIASKLPAEPDYFVESVKEILLAGKD